LEDGQGMLFARLLANPKMSHAGNPP